MACMRTLSYGMHVAAPNRTVRLYDPLGKPPAVRLVRVYNLVHWPCAKHDATAAGPAGPDEFTSHRQQPWSGQSGAFEVWPR